MEDTNIFKFLSIELRNEMDIISKHLIDEFMHRIKKKLDKLWEMSLKYEEQQNAYKRNHSQFGKSSKRPEKYLDALDNCSSTENNSSLVALTIHVFFYS